MRWLAILLAAGWLWVDAVLPGSATELIFFLRAGAKECFYQHADQGSALRLDYYVIRGGDYQVNVRLAGPDTDASALYDLQRETFDSHTLSVDRSGVYTVCFTDVRLSGGAKSVSFEFVATAPAPASERAAAEQTDQVFERLSAIGASLSAVATTQTLLRNRASADQSRADDVSTRVAFWAAVQSALIVAVGAAQICVLRMLFRLPKQAWRA